MKKNYLLVIVGMFLVLTFANYIHAEEINYSYSYSYEGIQITSLKYEPYPVNPGEYFDIWIKASLGSDVDYVKFELLDSFPFSVDESEESVREYYSSQSREIIMSYKVRVDKDSVEGLNDLKLQVTTSKVSSGGPISNFQIYVADAQTDFDLIIQDSTNSEISLAIANIGKNTANSMIVKIPEQDSFKASGTNGQMVGNLDSGDYTIVSFSISSIGRESENLIVQIDYTDNIGERRSVFKEIYFSSGVITGNAVDFEAGELPEGFPEGFQRGNFQMQQKKPKWPYFLSGFLILTMAILFVYQKNPQKFRNFLKKTKKEDKKTDIPDWIIKDKNKR